MAPDPRRCAVCGIPLRPSKSDSDTCGSASCRHLQRIRSPRPVARRCSFCSRPALPPDEVCADPRCRQLRATHLDARRSDAQQRKAVEEKLRRHEQELRARPETGLPERVVLARLPANEQTVAPLPEERRDAFATNIASSMNHALDDPDRPAPESPESPAGQAPLIQAACAACRGSCCTSGGDHAFLYPDHFRRYFRNHPEQSRDELISRYLSLLPSTSYHDSCVYHSDRGCALPRELRSNLCNSFLCGDLAELLLARSREAHPPPILACCIRNSRTDVVRSALIDDQGSRKDLGA